MTKREAERQTHARYVHDCDKCRYLGSGTVESMVVDWYRCTSSIIARYDDTGHSYWSSPVSMVQQIADHGSPYGLAALAMLKEDK